MNKIEYAKMRYYELEKRRNELLKGFADEYYFDGDIEDEDGIDVFLEEIHSGDITLAGNDDRDLLYIEDMMLMYELFITGKDGQHDHLIKKALQIKEQRADDIKKAEEVIAAMDEIIRICDSK